MDGDESKKLKGGQGVQSAETVLDVLQAFIGAEPMPMLKTLAERTQMHPAKVHRYLVSLCRSGFVEQDEMTSRYKLGPSALKLGFAAFSSLDSIRVARPMMADFCNRIGQTVVLAIWNAGRPTIAMRETLPGLLTMTATEGFALPILRSSIGNVFGAYMPAERIAPLVEEELALPPVKGVPASIAEVEKVFDDVRKRRLARTTGQLSAGSHSFAAPVFQGEGELSAALCALGPAHQFNSNWDSPIARILTQCASELSDRLGYVGQKL